MKIKFTNAGRFFLAFCLLLCVIAIMCSGCVSANPDYPASSDQAFIPSPQLTNTASVIRGVSTATAPVNPYSPLTDYAVEAGLGLAAAISAWLAKRKSDEAKSNARDADSLAQVITSRGLVLEALAVAGENEATGVVKHLEANKSATTPASPKADQS